MTRLSLLSIETVPNASRPHVEAAIKTNGFLPNLIGVLANSPEALEAYVTVSGINHRTSLSLAEREVVQITAARRHGCEFCVAGHTAVAVKKAGLDRKTVLALQAGKATGDPRLDAVQQFTNAVIETRGQVEPEDFDAFRKAGFGDRQALDVVLGVSLATLCNFANVLAESPINPELQPFRPGHFGEQV